MVTSCLQLQKPEAEMGREVCAKMNAERSTCNWLHPQQWKYGGDDLEPPCFSFPRAGGFDLFFWWLRTGTPISTTTRGSNPNLNQFKPPTKAYLSVWAPVQPGGFKQTTYRACVFTCAPPSTKASFWNLQGSPMCSFSLQHPRFARS